MKKVSFFLLCLLLVVSLMLPCAVAEDIDLSGLSYDQLVALKDRLNLAIWDSQEWQEVTVPQGIWIVGEDIPAGHWTVRPVDKWFTKVAFGDELKPSGTEIQITSYFGSELIYALSYPDFDSTKDLSEFSFTVKKGDYIEVEFGSAVFMPYSGKPDLGFK